MAFNSQAEALAAFQRARSGPQDPRYANTNNYYDPQSGMSFLDMSRYSSPTWGGEGAEGNSGGGSMWGGMTGEPTSQFRAYDGSAGYEAQDNFALNGLPYSDYMTDGSVRQGQWQDLDKNTIMEQLIPLGMMLGPMALTAMGAGGAAAALPSAGGSTAGAAGAGVTGLGEAGAMYAGLDAAGAASLGGGASVGGGAALGGLGAGAGAAGLAGAGGAGGAAAGGGGFLGKIGSALGLGGGGMGGSSLLGIGSTLLGALSGGQGQDANSTSTRSMDPRMQALFYGDLAPRTQGVLGSQMGQAQTAGNQLMSTGAGLLGRTAPGTAENPYLKSIADDMQRRTQEMLGQNNLAIQGNAVGVGGLGGSRQGVAQGIAAGRAADTLQGQLAGLYGGAYENDQNRLRQDWTLGSGMLNQGVNMPFQPLRNTADIYSPFSGFGTTSNNVESGGGWQGAIGGALAGASMGRQMGWW